MKQDKRPAGAAVKKRRFFNRISRKLMLFVVLMSMVLLALVWLLSVKLLEPMYNRRVLADLNMRRTSIPPSLKNTANSRASTRAAAFIFPQT